MRRSKFGVGKSKLGVPRHVLYTEIKKVSSNIQCLWMLGSQNLRITGYVANGIYFAVYENIIHNYTVTGNQCQSLNKKARGTRSGLAMGATLGGELRM